MILLIEEDDRFGDCENDYIPWSEVDYLLLNQHDDIVNGLYRYYQIFEKTIE